MQKLNKIKPLSSSELHLWFCAFLCLTLGFLPQISNFIWGNHDWIPVLYGNTLLSGLIEGRFSQYILLTLILDAHILPVLNILLGFLIYTLSIILLTTRFFNFQITPKSFLIIPVIATLPYITEITYFHFIVFNQLCWPLCITFSLLFAKKALTSNFILNTILCFLLLFLSIGGYPASINLFVTATSLFIFQDYQTYNNFKKSLIKTIPFLISLIFSFALLYIIYKYLQSNNIMLNLYNNNIISIKELFIKVPTIFLQSIESLFQPQPFFNLKYKLITGIGAILFIFLTLYNSKNLTNFFTNAFFVFIIFLSLKFSAILTNETKDAYFPQYDPIAFMVRTDFFSIPCFILYYLHFFLKSASNYIKNITVAFSVILLFININTNLYYSKVQVLGFSSETKLLERINNRIKASPNFKTHHYYTVMQIGEIPLRSKFYLKNNLEKYGYYTLDVPFVRYWIPNEFHNFYSVADFVKSGSSINPYEISPSLQQYLINDIKIWPNSNSIYIDNNYIIIPLSDDAKTNLQNQFKIILQGQQ